MSGAIDISGLLLDAVSDFAGTKGSPALQGIFTWASGLSAALEQEYQEDPVGTSAKILTGMVAVAALGPTVTAAAMTDVMAGYLGGGAVAEAMGGALTNYVLDQGGESLYAGTKSVLQSAVNGLGGTMTDVTASTSSNGNIGGSTSTPANFEIVSPDALGSGSYSNILINLPTLSQDSNTVAVITSPTTTTSVPSPASATSQTPSDAYTGSAITFTGNDGLEHTGTVLYRATAGDYVLDPDSPGYAAGGVWAVGSANVISITPPAAGTPNATSAVDVSQQNINSNGNFAVNTTDLTSQSAQGTGQYYGANGQLIAQQTQATDGSGSIAANGQAINYAAGSQINISTDAADDVVVAITPASGGTASTFTATSNGLTANNTDGAILGNVNVASDGSYTNTIVNSNYTAVANYSPSGQPASTTTTFTDGSHINTTYSNDPNSTWQSQTSIYNATGQLVGTAIAYKDGTSTMNDIDPASGTIIATTTDNSQAQPIQQTINPDATYDQVVSATAQALAAELISQVLIKNQIAGAATQAFADAVIQSELESSNATFTQNLSDDTFGIASGLAGSELGGLLAKDLGISKQVGSLVGATAANFVAQTILTSTAYSVGIADAAEYVATSSNFETGLLTTAGDEIGQSLAAVITPSTLAGEIIGDVGAAAESAALVATGIAESLLLADPITGAILIVADIAGINFIGNIIGDIATWIFGGGYRGLPYAESNINLSNNSFYILSTTTDNNGSPQPAITLANDVDSILNEILGAVGGQASLSTLWSIGYTGNTYITFQPNGSPRSDFGDAPSAIYNAVTDLLEHTTIVGGNPFMEYILATDNLNNIPQLLSDLGIAQSYALYSESPVAFMLGIAEAGSVSQYQAWQSVQSSATSLGLARLSYNGTTLTFTDPISSIGGDLGVLGRMPGQAYNFAIVDSSANVMANLGTLENLAVNGQLASIALTDATTPALSWSASGVAGYLNVLDAITTPFTVVVTDTAANVSSALADLQVLAANGHLTSITLTDSGKPTLAVTAADLSSDAGALSKLTGSYQFAITDSAANVSANFAAIQNLKALGELASLTLTDTGTPVLDLSYAQYTQSTAILSLISTPYKLGLVDTGANVSANIAALQTLATAGKLVSIALTDTTKPNVPVTLAQTTTYASVLTMITGQATITVTNLAANTSYTITDNGLTLPLAVGMTIQSNGTNSFLDALNGSNLTVTLTNSKAVVDSSGNATFTATTGATASTLHLATNGTATFTVGSDNLTFQSNALQSVSYANSMFNFGIATPSSAYAETITWNPTSGMANLVITAAGGQPVTTSLGQVNTGTVFSASGATITNTNSAGQKLLSTTVNSDGTQTDTIYNYSGGTNKDTVTTFNTAGQQTAIHWDHTDGSTYTTYTNPTTQAVIANLTVNANGSGSVSTANNQTVNFAAGNVATVSIGSTGDTLLTITTLSGSGIIETIDLSSGQIVTTVNGNDPVYTLANASASIDASSNLTLTGGGSTLLIPASGANATFTVGQDKLSFPQAALQSVSSASDGSYVFGLASPAAGFSESINWNPVSGLANLIMTPTGAAPTTTPLGPINQGSVLSVSGSTISITASNGTVVSSTTVATDGSLVNSFNNSAGALHTAANGVSTFVYGSDQLTFQSNTVQSYSSTNGIFSFNIAPASTAYTEIVTWNPANGMAYLVLTATGGQPVTTSLGQVNPGTIFSVSGTTITNTNSSGQLLLSTTINTDGSQIDTVYNYSGSTSKDTVTTLNAAGQQTSVHWDNTDGSSYTSYTNPVTQAVIANFSVNADGSGYVATNNNQTINFAAGNKASISIGSAGDTLLSIQTASGTTETLDLSSGKIVSTIGGNVLAYTLANAGGSIDASGNVTITGGGSTIVLPANGSNATFTVGQDSLSFPQNNLQSLSSVNNAYLFGVTSSVTGYSESISWNPVNGMASLVLTPTAGGQTLTTSIGQINPGNVLSISGPYITIASSTGAPISSTTVNSDGSQVNIYYNNSATVNETVTSTNTAGQITSIRYDNVDGSTYTSYYAPGTQTIIANRSVNADGSGYVATFNNQTVNFTSSDLFGVSIDASGNTLITITAYAGNTPAETLYLAAGQITSTINGHSLTYSLASPAISYDSAGDLTLTAAGSSLVLPANGSNYIFTVGQDTISLNPASVASVSPNGTGYNFGLNPVQGVTSEYVNWSPQTGIATLYITSTSGQVTSTNMGYINPGYVLKVSSSLITNTNASGVVINSYAIQTNGSVIATASGSTYTFANSNSLLGIAGSDVVTISGSSNSVTASANDTFTISGTKNTITGFATDKFTITGTGNTVTVSDTAADFSTDITALQTLAVANELTSVTLTDSGTPVVTLTLGEYSGDKTVLGKITKSYDIAFADTAVNLAANLSTLQTLATSGQVTSITATDGGTLALTTAQLTSDATAISKLTGTYKFAVTDTAANITANLTALQTFAAAGRLASITVSSGTLALTAAQVTSDASALSKLAGTSSITVSDSSANVLTNLPALQTLAAAGHLTSIALTNTTAPTLALTAVQLTADATALGKITSAYNISASGVLAANAATVAAQTHVTSVAVSDTSADIATNIAALQTLAAAGKLVSIASTTTTTPLALSAAQLTADATALGKITTAYNLSVSGVLAANAATVAAQTHVTAVAISDTAANFVANIASLQTLAAAGKLTSVALTDTATPTLALTAAQLTADATALGKITSAYNMAVSGVLAASAATTAAQTNVTSVTISDTAANIVTNLSSLQTLAAAGKLGSIVLTNTTTPTLALTAAQLTADATALGKITSAYNLSISGVLAANAATVAAQAHVTAVAISDTGADVVSNLAALQTLAAAGKLTSVTLTDTAAPTLALTAAQLTADATALGKITSAYNVSVSGVLAANAATVAAQAHVTSIAVSDTAADVVGNITSLQTLTAASKLSSVALTDASTPTLALTAAQLTADATALGKITSTYNIAVSGVLAANAATTAAKAHVTTVAISDTGADVLTNLAALQTLAAAGKLGSIALTDTATPTLTLTAAQLTADATALNKITSAYNISASGVLAANAATVAAQVHVTSVAISDTGADVVTNIAALQTLATAGKLTSIALTDTTTPTLALTAAQMTADATALGKITSAYNVSVSGVLAANAATVAAQAHVTSVAVSDTGADVLTSLTPLQTLAAAGHLTSIGLTDATAPTLAVTTAQLSADATALNKISSPFNETVSINSSTISGTITGTPNGNDTISFINAASAVKVTLASGGTAIYGSITDTLNGFRSAIGSAYNDTLTAGAANETLTGGGGTDTYTGYTTGATTFSDAAANLNGSNIANFINTDTLDVKDFLPSAITMHFTENANGATGILTVVDGSKSSAITLTGQHTDGGFYGYSDGKSGTAIGYLSPTDPTFAAFKTANPGYVFG